MVSVGFRRVFPRFFFPFRLACMILGDRRFMTLPVCCLVDELQFGYNKRPLKSERKRFVAAGDFTPHLVAVADHHASVEIAQLLNANLDYRLTVAYKSRHERLKRGTRQKLHARHLHSAADIEEYFEYRVRTIRSIMKYGCLSQRDLSDRHRASVSEFSPNRPVEHDIGCAIGPAGEIWMYRTGHHRLHIARQLGIEHVPVEVHFVHWRWIARQFVKYLRMRFAGPMLRAPRWGRRDS